MSRNSDETLRAGRLSVETMSGPRAEEGEHFVIATEISSALSAVQSAKGQRMEGRGWEV